MGFRVKFTLEFTSLAINFLEAHPQRANGKPSGNFVSSRSKKSFTDVLYSTKGKGAEIEFFLPFFAQIPDPWDWKIVHICSNILTSLGITKPCNDFCYYTLESPARF